MKGSSSLVCFGRILLMVFLMVWMVFLSVVWISFGLFVERWWVVS